MPDHPKLTRARRQSTEVCLFAHGTEEGDRLSKPLEAAGYKIVSHLESASPTYGRGIAPDSCDLIVAYRELLFSKGNTTLKLLRTHYPLIPAIIVSVDQTIRGVGECYRWGGRGYVIDNKELDKNLLEAADTVVSGGVYVLPEYAQAVVAYLVDRQTYNTLQHLLQPNEYRILAYLYQGRPPEKIAEHLDIGIRSVRTKISFIKKTLEITDIRMWQIYLAAEYPECIQDLRTVRW